MLTTKKQLAEDLGVSAARVSQFLREGMPARWDGQLDRGDCLKWVAGNNLGDAGERARALLRGDERISPKIDRSSKKAGPSIPPGFAVLEKISNPADASAVLALLYALTQIGAKASIAAHAAGAERAVAERTGQITTALFANFINSFVEDSGIMRAAEMVYPHPETFDEVNWKALGEPGEFAKPANQAAE